jgi:hypothetical protein
MSPCRVLSVSAFVRQISPFSWLIIMGIYIAPIRMFLWTYPEK